MKTNFERQLFALLNDKETRGTEIVATLKEHTIISYWYSQSLGGVDKLTLEEHTAKVLENFEIYFDCNEELILENTYFKLLLAIHDLGKPRAVAEKRYDNQHEYTLAIVKNVFNGIGFLRNDIRKITTLISADPIGRCLNKKHSMPIDESHEIICSMAQRLSVTVSELWFTLLVYYQCDVLGYNSLRDKVFMTNSSGHAIFSGKHNRFLFRDLQENERFLTLENLVLFG